jgi:ABC-type glutathione transport system ATPase component
VALLEVEHLEIGFGGAPSVVRDVSFALESGASLGLLGASGSGKSLTALAVLGLLPRGAQVRGGTLRFDGRELNALSPEERRLLRGGELGLVFQEPFTALNPLMRVGDQIAESLALHQGLGTEAARRGAAAALEQVGILPGPERAAMYPHQFSGGMRQRALLAMALACKPRLLIADEPTTALDATVQAQVLGLLKRLQSDLGFALLIISHDLAVIHALAEDAVLLEAGEVAERGRLTEMLLAPESGALERMIRACRALHGATGD